MPSAVCVSHTHDRVLLLVSSVTLGTVCRLTVKALLVSCFFLYLPSNLMCAWHMGHPCSWRPRSRLLPPFTVGLGASGAPQFCVFPFN